MNNIKFLLTLLVLLFSVFFFYNNVKADGLIISGQAEIDGQFGEEVLGDTEEQGDEGGKILGVYEAGTPINSMKFYFFVMFAIFFFLFLFWVVNEKEGKENI